MESRARIGNHPLHPMLIVVPAGAFIAALAFDLVYLASGDPLWWEATKPLMLVGVVGAVIAAVPGVVDLFAVARRQNAFGIGLVHGGLNLAVAGLFAWNDWLRWTAAAPPDPVGTWFGFWLTLVATGLLAVSGWLGWKMVYEYHVAVLEHPAARDPERAAPPRREPTPDTPTG